MPKSPIEKVKIAAQKKIKEKNDEIALLKTEIRKANGERVMTFKMPDLTIPSDLKVQGRVEISNLPVTQSVHIVNLKEVKEALKQESVKFPAVQDVRIVEHKEGEIKTIEWLPEAMAKVSANQTGFLIKALRALLGEGIVVQLTADKIREPIPVIITDGEGRILKNMGGPAFGGMPMGRGPSSGFYISTFIGSGRAALVTAGTRVPLSSTSIPCVTVVMTCPDTNTGIVYVGDSTVSAVGGSQRGVALSPLGSYKVSINDVSKLYMDSTANGDVVTFTYER